MVTVLLGSEGAYHRSLATVWVVVRMRGLEPPLDRVVTKETGKVQTRVIQDGVHPSAVARMEGTFRNPKDFDVNKGLANLHYLQKIGRFRSTGACWRSNASAINSDLKRRQYPMRRATNRHRQR